MAIFDDHLITCVIKRRNAKWDKKGFNIGNKHFKYQHLKKMANHSNFYKYIHKDISFILIKKMGPFSISQFIFIMENLQHRKYQIVYKWWINS